VLAIEKDDLFAQTLKYEFTADGFIHRDHISFKGSPLSSIEKIENPEKNFSLEILVYNYPDPSKSSKGHASLKFIDDEGHVISAGFYPEDSTHLFKTQSGDINSPDPYIFFSKSAMKQEKIFLNFPDLASYDKCLSFALKDIDERHDKQSYDSLHSNCSSFVQKIADFAHKECGAKEVSRTHTDSKISQIFKCFYAFLEIQAIAMYEVIKLGSFRNWHKPVYLPEHILLKNYT
jgi:hypothetical protein